MHELLQGLEPHGLQKLGSVSYLSQSKGLRLLLLYVPEPKPGLEMKLVEVILLKPVSVL